VNIRRTVTKTSGFTLIELLIVVIILAILAAVVIPQFSNSTSEAKQSAVDANLATVRAAVDMYYQQHGDYPSVKASSGATGLPTGATAGSGAAGSAQAMIDQLTMYSNAQGQTSTVTDTNFKYGPYLRKGVPVEPVSNSAAIEISTAGALGMTATSGTNAGWKFDNKTGQLIANSAALQAR
jgi:prepilin-type N-terminal cleavage/methylation domain-containing protein